MPTVKINLTETEKNEVDEIWQLNKERLRRDVLRRMGWKTVEDFLADVLRFGLDKASENPLVFLKMVRDEKDPLFVKEKKPEPTKKLEEGWGKAYA